MSRTNRQRMGDVVRVRRDGEELEVYNHISLSRTEYHYLNSVNGYETFEPSISISKGDAGDGADSQPPAAVTERIAELLWYEFDIDVEERGIEVIDVTDEAVTVL